MRHGDQQARAAKPDEPNLILREGGIQGTGVAQYPLEITLFGPISVRVDGFPLPKLRSRKGLWLLAILALRLGRDVDRSWLAATLWPDCSDGDALRSLRQSLHDLRRALGQQSGMLSCESPRSICLEAGVSTDVARFDKLVALGDRASLEEAVALYRGPLLEDCREEWIIDERRGRELALIAALDKLATEAQSDGDYASATKWLRLSIATEPFRDDLYESLMRALLESGRASAAIEVYNDYRSLLWNEMALAPAESVTAIYHKIRQHARHDAGGQRARGDRGDLSQPRISNHNPPSPLTRLIGRDKALGKVRALLQENRLVTLTGTGGIGKTRIAIEIAREAVAKGEDFVCFVELASVNDSTRLGDQILSALGQTALEDEPAAAVARAIGASRLLLVLDNCEHLAAECRMFVDQVLAACPNAVILATSRQALGSRGESVWQVPSLELPPDAGLASTNTHYSAIQLFTERARAGDARFTATDSNSNAIVEICRKLDGIPLAIELAASRVRSLSVEDIASRVSKLTGARSGSRGMARHDSLESAFRWSWDLLNEAERQVLTHSTTFSGGWTLAAAESICAGRVVDSEQVADVLSSLVEKSLVVFTPETVVDGQTSRYRLLETIRQFAHQRLVERGAEHEARERHCDYFLTWAEEINPRLQGADQGSFFAALETDHDNMRGALEWCQASGGPEKELRLCVALSRFWDTRGHLREGRARLESALSRATRDVPPKLRADAIGSTAWIAHVQSDGQTALERFEAATAIYREIGAEREVCHGLNLLGCVHANLGNLDAARALFEESLDLCRRMGGGVGIASALNNIGDIAMRQSDLVSARRYLEESASHSKKNGALQLHGITLATLAQVELRDGHGDEAEKYGSLSLRTLRDCGAVIEIPTGLDLLAVIAAKSGIWRRAALLMGAADTLRAETGVAPEQNLVDSLAEARAASYAGLGEHYEQVLQEGRDMDADSAISLALDEPAEHFVEC